MGILERDVLTKVYNGEIWGSRGMGGLKFGAIVLYSPEVEDSKRDLEDVLRFLGALRQPPIG